MINKSSNSELLVTVPRFTATHRTVSVHRVLQMRGRGYADVLPVLQVPDNKADAVPCERLQLLIEYLSSMKGGVGIAFSGGVDSTYLLRIARDACVGQVVPFLLVSSFLSRRERKWAHSIADEIGLPLREVPWYPLDFHCIWKNGSDRCYYCKYAMYHELWSICRKYGISNLLDGTQLDDLNSDRPGLKAIHELSVKIPLVYCNLNKNNIRRLSAKLCLPTWDRPSQSCLATRVVTGTFITQNLIKKIESAEELLTDMQMENTKLHVERNSVYLEISEEERLDVEGQWTKIQDLLQNIGFHYIYNGGRMITLQKVGVDLKL